ncbi:MAG: site-specific tyrosine recombinase/integron integrase [Bacteroidales bacterium]
MLKDRFAQFLEFEKRSSPHTLVAYRQDLEQFALFLSKTYNLEKIELAGHQMIRSWFISLIEEGLTPRTITRKMSSLKSFYNFARANGFTGINPMLKVSTPKVAKRLPEFVEQEKMELLVTFSDLKDKHITLRDQTILLVFYSTGIRLSELINIRIEDVDLVRGALRVLGKRNKERIVPIGDKVIQQLEKYMKERAEIVLAENKIPLLFVSPKGDKLYPRLIYRIVHSWLALVSTREKLSPHVLRHTFATHMLDNGADLNAIKDILGHSSLAATQVYTHNTITKLKTVYKQAHPRA